MKKQYFIFAALLGLFLFVNLSQAEAQNRPDRRTQDYVQKRKVDTYKKYGNYKTNQPRQSGYTKKGYNSSRSRYSTGSYKKVPASKRTYPSKTSRYRKPYQKPQSKYKKGIQDSLIRNPHIFVPDNARNRPYPKPRTPYTNPAPRQQKYPSQKYARQRRSQYRR